jgi:hypothetical protein
MDSNDDIDDFKPEAPKFEPELVMYWSSKEPYCRARLIVKFHPPP